MATGSSKSGRKPRQQDGAPRDAGAAQAERPAADDERVSRRAWIVASMVIMLAALLLRAVALELRPMHHDEGVNGHFLLGLLNRGEYRYDPSNYHGPTLYYFTLPLAYAAQKAGALGTWVVRLVPLVFGLGTVWLALAFRRYVGTFGALAAAALMAISPGMVFFSRYFIHEMMFVFFTVAVVAAAVKFYEAGEPTAEAVGGGGDERRPAGWSSDATAGAAYGAAAALAAAALAAGSLWLAYNPAQLKLGIAAVAFAFAATIALLWSYDGARSIYLVLGAISAALVFATKETAFISVGVILIAWASAEIAIRLPLLTRLATIWAVSACAVMLVLWLFGGSAFLFERLVVAAVIAAPITWGAAVLLKLFGGRDGRAQKAKKGRDKRAARGAEAAGARDAEGAGPPPLRLVERFGGWARVALLAVVSAGLFVFVNVLYYSSFFTNPKGVGAAIEAYKIWKKTGESGFHGYRWHKYLQWLVADWNTWQVGEEPLLVALAGLGLLWALWRTRPRFPLFAALWGFGLLAAYSLIKYKTPWLVLSMLPPFALAAGYALDLIYRRRGWRYPALAVLGLAVAVAAFQSYRVNFVHYDDDRYPYVYAHTKRQFLDLVAQIEQVAARTGDKYNASLNIAAENQEYWPLPWYVRDFKRVGYIGRVTQTSDDMVLIKDKQIPELEAALGSRYLRVGDVYDLRPGVKLVLYARRDLVF